MQVEEANETVGGEYSEYNSSSLHHNKRVRCTQCLWLFLFSNFIVELIYTIHPRHGGETLSF